MADPLTIIGTTAASAQLLELAFNITKLIYGVYSEIRKAPAFVTERLQCIEQIIGIATIIQQSPALQTSEVAGAVNLCLEKTRQIELRLKKAFPGNDERRWHRLVKSLVVVFEKKDIVALFENLERDKSSLILAVQAIQPEIQRQIASQVNILQSTATSIGNDTSAIAQLSRDVERISLLTPTILERVVAVQDAIVPILTQQQLDVTAKPPKSHIIGQYNFPNRRVRGFVGREDYLAILKEMISRPVESIPRIIIIRGMGGQGKTQVSLQFCRRGLDGSLFSACFWVDATSESTARKSLEEISELLQPNQPEAQTGEARIRFVMKTLISFANIQDFIPENAHGTIIFTTRHADAETLASEGCTIELGCLQPADATKLLLRQSLLQPSEENLHQGHFIAARLGYHALAIAQAGSYLKRRRIPLDQFLAHYDRQKRAILKEIPSMSQYRKTLNDDEIEISLSVFATWELSVQQLAEIDLDGSKSNILTLLAFFDPNNIPEVLFKTYCDGNLLDEKEARLFGCCLYPTVPNSEDPEVSIKEISGDWNHDQFAEILSNLGQLSLIQTYDLSEDGLYHVSLHPLVKDWIKLRMSIDATCEFFLLAFKILFYMIEDMWDDIEDGIGHRLALSKRWVIPHLVETNRNFQEIFEARSVPAPSDTWSDCEVFGKCFDAWTRYKEARPWFERSRQYNERFYGPDSEEVIRSLLHLSWNSIYLCDYEVAETYASRNFNITSRKFPPYHVYNIVAMDALACTLTTPNRLGEAEAIYNEIINRTEGSNTSILGGCLSNFGWMLLLAKRYEEAENVLRRAFRLQEASLGPDHSATIIALENHDKALFTLGRYIEAETAVRVMLQRCERTLGPDHNSTIVGTNTLAEILFERGDITLAKKLCQHALSWRTDNYSPTHRYVVESAKLLAKINAAEEARLFDVEMGLESPTHHTDSV